MCLKLVNRYLILLDAFYGHHIGLHIGGRPHQHVQRVGHIEPIAEGEAHQARLNGAPGENSKEAGKQDEQVADDLQSHGEPTVGHHRGVIADLVLVHLGVANSFQHNPARLAKIFCC
jgi:hypothetical protein